MWSDPIQNAAIRGDNIQEAEKLGISLEELLHNQYLANIELPKKEEKFKKKKFFDGFWKWLFRIN